MNKSIGKILVLWVSMSCSSFLFAEFRDPTRPPANIYGPTVVSPSLFVLNAIISASNRRIAVINGLSKKVGDEVLGEDITAINKNTVRLEGPSGKITLFLFGKPVKRFFQTVCKGKWKVCMDARD
jgi:hypothetical protein